MTPLESQIRDYLYTRSQDEGVSEISKMAEFVMEDRKRIADELELNNQNPRGGIFSPMVERFIERVRKGE